MKTREDAVKIAFAQLDPRYTCTRNKGSYFHYGLQELRELLDFIYESEPKSKEQELPHR